RAWPVALYYLPHALSQRVAGSEANSRDLPPVKFVEHLIQVWCRSDYNTHMMHLFSNGRGNPSEGGVLPDNIVDFSFHARLGQREGNSVSRIRDVEVGSFLVLC